MILFIETIKRQLEAADQRRIAARGRYEYLCLLFEEAARPVDIKH